MFKYDNLIEYTLKLKQCTSTSFSYTYYFKVVLRVVDFDPHPNRYPSGTKVSTRSNKLISEKLCPQTVYITVYEQSIQ